MRGLRGSILLLLFVTTFGRCFAEQYGLLGDDGLACCDQEVACGENHASPHHDEENPAPADEEERPDCPVCVLIDSNALVTTSPTGMPAPAFSFVSTFFAADPWEAPLFHFVAGHPETVRDPGSCPPPRLSLSLTELVLYSAPVRGPSLG